MALGVIVIILNYIGAVPGGTASKWLYSGLGLIGVGFVMAFISGVFVVKKLLDFVSRHGFMPFAIWRIAVGTLGFVGLAIWG